MRISDWRSDVCSSDLPRQIEPESDRRPELDVAAAQYAPLKQNCAYAENQDERCEILPDLDAPPSKRRGDEEQKDDHEREDVGYTPRQHILYRSEDHTSELQSLMRISYAVFSLKQNT